MSQSSRYVVESLASSGLAVISGVVAATLRPDLWHTGTSAGMDLAKMKLPDMTGCSRYTVVFEGLNRPVEVLARSHDRLALRLEWLTGLPVSSISELGQPSGGKAAAKAEPAKPDPREDRYSGISTKEEGRTCGECERLTANGECRAEGETGVQRPHAGIRRRCLAFQPQWDARDSRTGRQLWPELLVQEVSDGA